MAVPSLFSCLLLLCGEHVLGDKASVHTIVHAHGFVTEASQGRQSHFFSHQQPPTMSRHLLWSTFPHFRTALLLAELPLDPFGCLAVGGSAGVGL